MSGTQHIRPDATRQLQAFSELVVQHQAAVRAFLGGFIRDPAAVDDVAQEVFLSAYKDFGAFEGRSSVRTWLFGIARNMALHHLRDEMRRRRREDRAFEALLLEWRMEELEGGHDQARQFSALEQCLAELPVKSAQLLKDYYTKARTGPQHALDKRESSVRMTVLRLRMLLRECVEKKLAIEEGTI